MTVQNETPQWQYAHLDNILKVWNVMEQHVIFMHVNEWHSVSFSPINLRTFLLCMVSCDTFNFQGHKKVFYVRSYLTKVQHFVEMMEWQMNSLKLEMRPSVLKMGLQINMELAASWSLSFLSFNPCHFQGRGCVPVSSFATLLHSPAQMQLSLSDPGSLPVNYSILSNCLALDLLFLGETQSRFALLE